MADDDEIPELAEAFAGVARALAAKPTFEETLDCLVTLAVQIVEACEHAGVSVIQGRSITSPTASDHTARLVDAIQQESGEGPCFDAIREHDVFHSGDLATEDRWPDFSLRAVEETGIRSVLVVRLYLEEDTIGSLNFYSTTVDAFDRYDEGLAVVLATHGAVALEAARRADTLEAKALSRDAIGRAKGILIARSQITDAEAFEILRSASQRENVKLIDIANRINDQNKPA